MDINLFINQVCTQFGLNTATVTAGFRQYINLKDNNLPIPGGMGVEESFLTYLIEQKSYSDFIPAAIQEIYGSVSAEEELALLEEFRASARITTLTDSPEMRKEFLYFLSSPLTKAAHALYGISSAAADHLSAFRTAHGGVPSADSDQNVSDFLSDQKGTETIGIALQEALSAYQNTEITVEILSDFRKYANLRRDQAISNTDETKSLFIAYLKERLSTIQKSEALNALSPEEQNARQVMFSTFEIILKMLNVLQKSLQVESKALKGYADWESNITDLISATPLYGPDANATIVVNTDDFGETSFGYGNITARDILRYLMHQMNENGTSSEIFSPKYDRNTPTDANGIPLCPSDPPGFQLVKNTDLSYTYKLYDRRGTVFLSGTATPKTGSSFSEETFFDDVGENILSSMTTTWNNSPSIMAVVGFNVQTRNSDGSMSPNSLVEGQGTVAVQINLKTAWDPQKIGKILIATDPNLKNRSIYDYVYTYSHGVNGTFHDFQDPTLLSQTSSIINPINICLEAIRNGGPNAYYYDLGKAGDPHNYNDHAVISVELESNGTVSLVLYRAVSPASGDTSQTDWCPNGSRPNFHPAEHYAGWDAWNYDNNPVKTTEVQPAGIVGPWTTAWPDYIPFPAGADISAKFLNPATQVRGERNSQLQLYIQSAQAKKSNIDTSLKTMQNLISQTTQAITNQTNILDLIMQTMKSILSALFRS